MREIDYGVYLVTDRDLSLNRPLTEIVEKAAKGGVSIVQLREKTLSTRDFYLEAKKIKTILDDYKIPLIINDRLDIALAVDADGLHIGQSDIPYHEARKILGKNKIIGLSVETIEQARETLNLDIDYLAVSPVFFTNTKNDIARPLGLDGLREIKQFAKHKIIGIGGINKTNIKDVILAGADGAAVVSAICSAEDSQLATTELKNIISEVTGK